jgi:3-oxoadipate enol-lactonase
MSVRAEVLHVHGARLGVRRAGPTDAPKVLLLHGIGSNSRSFVPQLEALSDRFDLAAWDAPGYGASDDPPHQYGLDDFAAAAETLVGCLGWESAHVLGHSFGGVVAQALYCRSPKLVRSLILSDTNAGSGTLPEPERSQRVQRRLDDLATRTPREIAERRGPGLLAPGASPELLASIVDVMAAIRPPGYAAAAVALGTADFSTRLACIEVRTLVIHGALDTVIPPGVGEDLARRIPCARLVLLPGAGHASNQQVPEAYNQALRAFLEDVA